MTTLLLLADNAARPLDVERNLTVLASCQPDVILVFVDRQEYVDLETQFPHGQVLRYRFKANHRRLAQRFKAEAEEIIKLLQQYSTHEGRVAALITAAHLREGAGMHLGFNPLLPLMRDDKTTLYPTQK